MDNFKKVVRENAIIILIGVVVVSVFLVQFISRAIEGSKIYQSGNNGEIEYIEHKFKDNEYKVVDMDEFDIINYYYRDFITMLINNPEEAWEYIDDNNKEEKFNNDMDTFLDKAKQIVTINSKNNRIEKYRKRNGKYTIIDSENHMYTIDDDGVWNYKVSYLGQGNKDE